jgi:4-carboxymuconolactone decarboxylase
MTRIKDWTLENLTEEQKEIHDTIVSGPRGHVVGPLRIWLNNPGLARSAQTVGEYARYGTSLSKGLSELAIITTGRVWSSAFEWEHHAPLAIEGGIDPENVNIISMGQRPNFTKAEEEAVFDFAAEANILKNVSDNTYNNLVKTLNETAAIDIVGICGYYSLISMTLNVFKVPSDTDKWPLPEIKDFSKMIKN